MHATRKTNTMHNREDVAATVTHLTRSGARPSVVWERRGARTTAYLYAVGQDGTRTRVARIDDATDGDRALGKDRATWAAVEAGATFTIEARHANAPRPVPPRPLFGTQRRAVA